MNEIYEIPEDVSEKIITVFPKFNNDSRIIVSNKGNIEIPKYDGGSWITNYKKLEGFSEYEIDYLEKKDILFIRKPTEEK